MIKPEMRPGMEHNMDYQGGPDELLDARLEALLAERARSRSEFYGLEERVMSSLEARELAQAWLRRHGSLLSAPNGHRHAWTGAGGSVLRRIERLSLGVVEALERTFRLVPLTAALGGALAGWLLAVCLPTAAMPVVSAWLERLVLPGWRELVPQAVLLSVALAIAGAVAGALTSQWQCVREYYG